MDRTFTLREISVTLLLMACGFILFGVGKVLVLDADVAQTVADRIENTVALLCVFIALWTRPHSEPVDKEA